MVVWNPIKKLAVEGLKTVNAQVQEIPWGKITRAGWLKITKGSCIAGGGVSGAWVWLVLVDWLGLPEFLKDEKVTPVVAGLTSMTINWLKVQFGRFKVVVAVSE